MESNVVEPTTRVMLIDIPRVELEALKLKDLKHIWNAMKKKYQGKMKQSVCSSQKLRHVP